MRKHTPERIGPRPIEQLQDVMVHQRPLLDDPFNSYYATSLLFHDRIDQVKEAGTAGVSPELERDMVHVLALLDSLRGTVLSDNAATFETQREREMMVHYDETLEPHGLTMASLLEQAGKLRLAEIADYYMGKLESYTRFLQTGTQPTNWPEAQVQQRGLLSHDIADKVRATAEITCLPLHFYPNLLGNLAPGLAERYEAWLMRTCHALLAERRIGRAVPLINTVLNEEDGVTLLLELTDAMTLVRTAEDESNYRHLYSFIAGILREPLRSTFLEMNPRIAAPLVPGAKREIMDYGDKQMSIERYEENDPVTATLASGHTITLPYRHFAMRTLLNYSSPTEYELNETQTAVDYDALDTEAKRAIEKAWRAADLEEFSPDEPPRYQRLALKPSEAGNTLHSVVLKPGYHRRMHRYPDDHGFVTSETEPNIEATVRAATPVLDTFLVVPNQDDYMYMATYLDTEPNIFGPGNHQANAFWIAGEPRLVVDKSGNPKNMRSSRYSQSGNDEPRWVIVPVRYYQIEEHQS